MNIPFSELNPDFDFFFKELYRIVEIPSNIQATGKLLYAMQFCSDEEAAVKQAIVIVESIRAALANRQITGETAMHLKQLAEVTIRIVRDALATKKNLVTTEKRILH